MRVTYSPTSLEARKEVYDSLGLGPERNATGFGIRVTESQPQIPKFERISNKDINDSNLLTPLAIPLLHDKDNTNIGVGIEALLRVASKIYGFELKDGNLKELQKAVQESLKTIMTELPKLLDSSFNFVSSFVSQLKSSQQN